MTITTAPATTALTAAASKSSITVVPVAGTLGAEVRGVDLTHTTADDIALIRDALLKHRVIFFREQHLDEGSHLRFAAAFGPLTLAHPTVPSLEDAPEVFDIDSATGQRTNVWHTDVTFVDRPPLGSVLRAIDVPPFGGDTVWADTVSAYASLPDPIRTLVDGLDVIHTNAFDYARALATVSPKHAHEVEAYGRTFSSSSFTTRHPLVQVHPETGERALLAGGFARSIHGLSSSESKAILRIVHSAVTRIEHTVRWRWAPGDVAFWDNRSTQHYAVADYGDAPRRVQRVTIAGGVPTGIDGRRSVAIEGDSSHYLN